MPQTRDSKKTPTSRELTEMARRLVAEQNTMTLATADGDTAWAAPVYYVFVKSTFYFVALACRSARWNMVLFGKFHPAIAGQVVDEIRNQLFRQVP